MNSRARIVRDAAIVEDRARGLSWTAVADRHAVSPATARRALASYRATDLSLRDCDPTEVVEDMIAEYRAAMDALGEIAHGTTNDAVKVGAIRQRLKAMADMRQLMQETGTLPRDLGQLKLSIELNVIAERFVRVLREHDAQPELVDALMGALRPPATAPGLEFT